MTSTAEKLDFYITPPHHCSYLDNKLARTLFADPDFKKNTSIYSALAKQGFRRSGKHIYMPRCDQCSACIPVRIPVDEFKPRRSQKRNIRKNHDIDINVQPACFKHEHFDLFCKYINQRHSGGGMDNPTPDSYSDFLMADWINTFFIEFFIQGKLVAIAVTDQLDDSLSAVYTFFDPCFAQRGPGIFAILYQIEMARKTGRKWLYLGYWIKNCQKMHYKNSFKPLEYFTKGRWIRY